MTIPQQSRGQLVFDAVPIIDFSLAESDPAKYFEQLRFALEDVGFGVFVNVPGFEDAFQKELFGIADRLFKQSQEWKDAHGTANSYALRGYFRADDIPGDHKVSMRDATSCRVCTYTALLNRPTLRRTALDRTSQSLSPRTAKRSPSGLSYTKVSSLFP